MNKVKILRAVNVLLFSSFSLQVVTIILIFFKLKIKLVRPVVVFELHEYNGLLLAALACTHIVLNWGWIKANFFKR